MKHLFEEEDEFGDGLRGGGQAIVREEACAGEVQRLAKMGVELVVQKRFEVQGAIFRDGCRLLAAPGVVPGLDRAGR